MGAEQSAEAESRPGEPSAAGRCLAGSEGCAGTAAVEKGTMFPWEGRRLWRREGLLAAGGGGSAARPFL